MSIVKYISCFLVAATTLLMVSCSKDDDQAPDYNSDKTRLKEVIDSLTNVYNNAVEGSHPGEYVVGAKDALDSVIALANQVYTGEYTQQQVNNAVSNLLTAGETFAGQLLQEVSAENLMAFWKFNGNAADSSGNGHDGTLTTGYIGASAATATDGGTLPQLTTDRFGRADMAYDFGNGATIQVPYAADLNPQNISICLWVKRHATSASNYMVSLNRWNGYKFQLQSNDFPFFTFQDSDNGYHDIDANPGTVPQDVWTHVAMTYTNGTMSFYIDGTLAKTVSVSGTPITVSPAVDLAIGNELPRSQYTFVNESDAYYYWGGSFFNGALDEVRLYNTALTAAEVLSIYTQEKSL